MSRQMIKIGKTARFVIDVATKFPRMPRAVRGVWLKESIQTLGPTYVKIGQFVASRPDVLGDDPELVRALKTLHDDVDPLPWSVVSEVIGEHLPMAAFKIIERKPLASASIAQVHRATLRNGDQVVIKMKRPNIDAEISMDLQVIELWLIVLSLFVGSKDAKIVDAQNMVRDIQNSIMRETNMSNEIANMEYMREVSANARSIVVIPRVYKDLSSSELIVMEYVPSIKFRTVPDPKLAYMLMDVFVQQFLQHGLLHGDPHEGNVALSQDKKRLVMYDLGHVISLDAKLRSLMKILVFEIMTENIDGVIRVMKQMPEVIEIRQEDKIRDYIAKYIQYIKTIDIKVLKSMSPSDGGDIPIKFSGTIYEIVRVFGIIEGVCIDLDPDFKYETVFVKYIDVLLFDIDFFTYKMEADIKSLFSL